MTLPKDPQLEILRLNKESGFKYKERRYEQWKENYTLYRDTIKVNRLTQRQSVNVPLMKQTVRTLLKDVDDLPVLYFENLDNDKQKEVFINEYYKYTLEYNNMEVKDIVDKRQVFLFGRTFKQLQIADGMVEVPIIDPTDILVDRYVDPTNLDSSRFLIHTHIFKTLSDLEKNENYDKERVHMLKIWHASDQGLIKSQNNVDMLQLKNEKLSDLGLDDVEEPVLGETYVELSMHFVYVKENENDEEQLHLIVEADDMFILMDKKLEDIIGKTKDNYWRNHFPYITWADDVDMQDFWTDGVADIVRTPNKVLNAWFSQVVENRTLRNFGMHYYNSSLEGFNPQTFNPIPWGWYPIPLGQDGKISDVLQKVDIPALTGSIDEMSYVVQMIEKASGATATQQGTQTEKRVTLGEVELALGEAKERVKGMSKFYTPAWKEFGVKFLKLIEAAPDKLNAVKLYKKGLNSNDIYGREIKPDDWKSASGYQVKVWSQDEKNQRDTQSLEKLNAVKANIPYNPKLEEIYQRKLLEFAGLTPEETNEIMEIEKKKIEQAQMQAEMANQMALNGQMGVPTTPAAPPLPAAPTEIK